MHDVTYEVVEGKRHVRFYTEGAWFTTVAFDRFADAETVRAFQEAHGRYRWPSTAAWLVARDELLERGLLHE